MEALSNAEKIRKSYRELLADGLPHSRQELFSYANRFADAGVRYTDGMLTGALRSLVTNTPDYECVERGTYRKRNREASPEEAPALANAYIDILRDTLKKAENVISTPFHMLHLSEGEREKLARLEACFCMIAQTLHQIED